MKESTHVSLDLTEGMFATSNKGLIPCLVQTQAHKGAQLISDRVHANATRENKSPQAHK